MKTNLLRCVRAINVNYTLTLAGVFLAFAGAAEAAAVVQTIHQFGEAGPGFVKLLQANDGNLYGTTFSGGANTNGTIFQYTTNGAFTTLYSFTGGNDGGNPEGNLAQAPDGNLYGTARYGGASSNGTAFRISTTGTFTNIYTFSGAGDGGTPRSGFLLGADGYLYGTTIYGGAEGNGTVFRMTTNGTLKTLYSFTGGSDGSNPHTGLIQGKDGGLYGTTVAGGADTNGTIFRITTNSAFSLLYTFTGGSDGGAPDASLYQAGNSLLYGTATAGGAGYGVVFQIATNGGASYSNLYSFTDEDDGGNPFAGLVQANDGNLYGTTEYGGTNDAGTIFQMTTAGVLNTLYSFSGGSDGNQPFSDLMQTSDGSIYGSTFLGGTTDSGTLFSLETNATSINALFSFVGAGDGANPEAALFQASDSNFYGTTFSGGSSDAGTVFRISTNGTQTTLYSFAGGLEFGNPGAGLVQASDGILYGTASSGGLYGAGEIFSITTNGSYTQVYGFTGQFDGAVPNALVLGTDGNLYGTTGFGGADSYGTVFQYPLPSGPFTLLHSFAGTTDGGNPEAGLVQANDGNFYGTTSDFNLTTYGTIFRITSSGAFTSIYAFTNGLDGNTPLDSLVQAGDGYLYGTASDYGTGDPGTVFRVTTGGVLTELYSFAGGDDGYEPYSGLVQATNGILYGTTWEGGADGAGTIFSMTTNGTFASVYSFTGGDDGADPGANLVQGSDGNLYGTAAYGGEIGEGTIVRVVLSSSSSTPVATPVTILSPLVSSGKLDFSFQTVAGQSYTIQQNSKLGTTNWTTYSNFTGAGSLFQLAVPLTNGLYDFFRVQEP